MFFLVQKCVLHQFCTAKIQKNVVILPHYRKNNYLCIYKMRRVAHNLVFLTLNIEET